MTGREASSNLAEHRKGEDYEQKMSSTETEGVVSGVESSALTRPNLWVEEKDPSPLDKLVQKSRQQPFVPIGETPKNILYSIINNKLKCFDNYKEIFCCNFCCC